MEQRIPWDDLPQPLRQAIEARTGPIKSVRVASAGQNSPLAVIIDARDGRVFVKGLPSAHRRVITQAREAAVAQLVRDISPALLWHFDEAGWNVLGYEYAPGHHADYSPGSPDLDRVAQLMEALSAVKVPDGPGQRAGIHACWVLRLMASGGHTAHEAERHASRLPAFQAADPAHIDLFAAVNVRLWDEIAQSSTSAWTAKMAQAGKSWAACRQAR